MMMLNCPPSHQPLLPPAPHPLFSSNSNVTTSSRTVSSTDDSIGIGDMELSGKITGSQVNPTNGDVESVLFGDWSLNSTASSTSFSATFTMMPLADSSDSNNATEYRIDNLRANTV
jgi:hypothetical protein